jgi:S-methylmethionine-dependent homocysteine/selenocysteine methylase
MVVSGCVGPRGDGYDPGRVMSAEEAEAYHAVQIGIFAATEADLVTAVTMTNGPEAIGVTRAAARAGMPVAISFTLETDGRLPTGETLKEAVAAVDAATGGAPLYYMINCAHPTHFADVLASGEPWLKRLKGLRANASKRSHAELDAAPDLDAGDPVELGRDYRRLLRHVPHVTILGGCCGTDHRHVEAICVACADAKPRSRAA